MAPTTDRPHRVILTRLADESTTVLTFKSQDSAESYIARANGFNGKYSAESFCIPVVGDDVAMIEFGQPFLTGTVRRVGERELEVDLTGEPHGGTGYDFWPINSCRRIEDLA